MGSDRIGVISFPFALSSTRQPMTWHDNVRSSPPLFTRRELSNTPIFVIPSLRHKTCLPNFALRLTNHPRFGLIRRSYLKEEPRLRRDLHIAMRSVSHFLLFVTVALASFATCTPMEPAAPWVAGDGGAAARHQTTGVLSHSNGKHLGRGEKGPRADMTGRPSVRREIRDLHANYPDQFALYMLGLLAFQNVDQSDPLSYYSITGTWERY